MYLPTYLLGDQRRRVPPMSPQPELGLHEDARADRVPRLGGVHDGEIEATKELAARPATGSVSQPGRTRSHPKTS